MLHNCSEVMDQDTSPTSLERVNDSYETNIEQIKQLLVKLGIKQDNRVYCSYYSIDSLKNAINECKLIQKLDIIDDIINIICQFCGITKFSQKEKSKSISVLNSNDSDTEFAILTQNVYKVTHRHRQRQTLYHTIVFNEWIHVSENKRFNNKSIYRYLFKLFTDFEVHHNNLTYIGFVTSKFIEKMDKSDANYYYLQNTIGNDSIASSISWYTCAGFAAAKCNDNLLKLLDVEACTQSVNWKMGYLTKTELKQNDETGNCYLFFEFDFNHYLISVRSNLFSHDSKRCLFKMPSTLVANLQDEEIKFGVTLHIDTSKSGQSGVGLVKYQC